MTFISLYEPSWRRVVVCGKFLEIAFQMLLFGKVEFELRKTCETPNVKSISFLQCILGNSRPSLLALNLKTAGRQCFGRGARNIAQDGWR
ncbi:MAG: hypothetical protein HYU74_03950 [Dechloromonas sp.]|nr:hypothetical protein [Dechloromonas sp.]